MFLILLFFLSKSEEWDKFLNFPIEDYDEWQEVPIDAKNFQDKKVLITGENVILRIQGGNIKTSIRVESETRLIFEPQEGDIPHYVFDFLITNGTVSFMGNSQFVCKGILRLNYLSFNAISNKIKYLSTTQIELFSHLIPLGFIIFPTKVSLLFTDSGYFTIETNKNPIKFILPATCIILTPDNSLYEQPIQTLPTIEFYGDSTSLCGITLLNEWESVNKNWGNPFNIITQQKFQFGYESETPILQDKFKVTAKEIINTTGILGGVYNIVDTEYTGEVDGDILNYADGGVIFSKKFVPINSHLQINFYGFFKPEKPFKFESLIYPGTHVVLQSMNETSFITAG